MGYEEVETVLPADFVPQPDPVPEKESSSSKKVAEVYVSESEPESEAEDSGCNGLRRKKKKKRSSRSRSGRSSLLSRWRSSRSKSRGRKSKEESSEASSSKNGDKKRRSSSKSSKRSLFPKIKKVDSNATEVASNTTKAKELQMQKKEQPETVEEESEIAAINGGTEGPLPTVREGSPANTTITALTGDNTVGDDKAAGEESKEGITSPSPAPTAQTHNSAGETSIAATELSIEVGDENDQFEVPVESPFNSIKEKLSEEKQELLAIQAAPSKDASVRSTRSNRSIRSNKSSRSSKSNRSVKSPKSGEKSIPDVAAALSSDNVSVKSSKSTASVKSSKSTKSTSSKRSLLKIKASKSKEADDNAPPPGDAPQEESTSDKENAPATEPEQRAREGAEGEAPAPNTSKGKWVKKVSLSIGGYKTSFQFSDPMANLADAVNDALDVVGGDETLAEQAKEMDEGDGKDKDAESEGVEEERDYDENPTRLFMYLQQRAWGLALNQLQKHPDEARVWVYRKARPEKAPNVEDGDERPGAMVVQHTALVVHDGNEGPKFRWKLLPLHAAIVLGAPTEIIQDIIRAYPGASRKTDERGSLPVHLAASRLDVDPEGEKVVLQLFGAYPDSIEMQDRKGRTPPELAKLARARKEIEEQRKADAVSQASQMGVERTASQHERETSDDGSNGSGSGDGSGDGDDERSVKSSLSGKFQQMLRKSKSTDTVDRRKKKKKKSRLPSLGLAKSMDAGHDDESTVDDATIAESLGPGFAFVKTSEAQEERERAATPDSESKEKEEPTEEEIIVAAKKAMVPNVSKEYQTPEQAPSDTFTPRGIPLPMSFSMKDDDSSIRVSGSDAEPAAASAAALAIVESKSKDEGSHANIPDDQTFLSIKTERPKRRSSKEKTVDRKDSEADDKSVRSSKSVKISEEPDEVQEIAPAVPDAEDSGSDDSNAEPVNEGLRVLLEKAAENAGRGGRVDVTEFVRALEDEWVTDVEALRRLDGETLDDLLPLMLSRELQRLINHADSIDSKFLKEDRQALARGRSPKKSAKKKKKKRSHRRAKKRNHYRPVTPPDGPLTPISEEADSPASATSDDGLSIVTEARSVASAKSSNSAKSAPPKLSTVDDEGGDDEQPANDEPASEPVNENADADQEEEEDEDDDEEYELDDIAQSASVEDLEIRKLHASLIADARKKFPTREALEDSIRERQSEVEAAVNSGFDVDKETLARAALADDEVRKLLPLRLILPTVADLNEMIGVLQVHKEGAMRDLDMDKARSIQSEIDELQDQIDREERYLLKKRMGETKCQGCGEMFPTEKRMKGVLRTTEKHCGVCRADGASSSAREEMLVETVDSRDDEDNN